VVCVATTRSRASFRAALVHRRRADLRAQVIGTGVYTAAFVLWVALFQTQWRKWGSFGTNMLIYVPDQQWWNQ
jgi:hypothetical protein